LGGSLSWLDWYQRKGKIVRVSDSVRSDPWESVQTIHTEHYAVTEDGGSTSQHVLNWVARYVRFMMAHLVTLATKQTAIRYIILNLWAVLTYFVYLFIYDLFNDGVNSSDYIASNNRMSEWWIETLWPNLR
jgi:hypothetical protein